MLLTSSTPSLASEPDAPVKADKGSDPVLAEITPPDPSDPAFQQIIDNNRRRFEAERTLRKMKLTHFGQVRDPAKRAQGLTSLRDYTDPATFPALLAAFEREERDVRTAVLDHLAAVANPDGDINLAWAAIHDNEEWFRTAAADRLATRVESLRETPLGVQSVIAAGLRYESTIAQTAALAERLRLFEAIPALIQAQTSAVSSGNSNNEGVRAFIVVGRQISFVSDLTPVVGTNAVGFDPTVSVITEGSTLSVGDVFVTSYQTTVLPSLARLASAAWGGQSVAHLGGDPARWREWYTHEYLPYAQAQRLRAEPSPAEPAAEPAPKPAGP